MEGRMEHLIGTASLIITLDVDALLFEKLSQIQATGCSAVELNNIEPSILNDAQNTYPNLRLGVSNILNTEQLEKAYEAGAHFASSPGFMPSLVQTASIYGFHYLPGIATFSEAMHAASLSCQHVRPFPATHTFCTQLAKYLPELRLFPAEILWDDVRNFLDIPTVAATSLLNPDLHLLQTTQTCA
jgi:2-dehydro-3-deoxyphosphogluconate aldolase / (4S)-4-hydroxy-2-oxoglutarate aldolase